MEEFWPIPRRLTPGAKSSGRMMGNLHTTRDWPQTRVRKSRAMCCEWCLSLPIPALSSTARTKNCRAKWHEGNRSLHAGRSAISRSRRQISNKAKAEKEEEEGVRATNDLLHI